MVHLGRLRDKSRRVLEITEVAGYSEGRIVLNPLFVFEEAETPGGEEDDFADGRTVSCTTGPAGSHADSTRAAGIQADGMRPVIGRLKWTGNMLTRTYKLKMAGIRCRLGGDV